MTILRRGLTVIFSVACLCAAGLSSARLVGHASPAITMADWLRDGDGLPCADPCILGIRPGITLFDDALNLIQQHPLTSHLHPYPANRVEVTFLGGDVRIGVVEDNDGTVYSIHLEPERRDFSLISPDEPTLRLNFGEAINVLGYPTDIRLTEGRTGLINILSYPERQMLIVLYRRGQEISPYDPFVYLLLYRADAARVYESELGFPLWRGFSSRRTYVRVDLLSIGR